MHCFPDSLQVPIYTLLFSAGDFVKFNLPMASAMTILSWGGIMWNKGYAGQEEYLRQAVKWGNDYFMKCHVSDNEYYAQVGFSFNNFHNCKF